MKSPNHFKVRLRDFIITKDGWIFSSADYHHPEGVRGVLRYVPDPNGERTNGTQNFTKYDFDEAFQYMRTHKPN